MGHYYHSLSVDAAIMVFRTKLFWATLKFHVSLDMSIKMHGGQDAMRLEFKHGSLAIYFCFVDLATCRYCITRKIACYNCWPVSWPEQHRTGISHQDSHQPFNCLGGFIHFGNSSLSERLTLKFSPIFYYIISSVLIKPNKPNSKISLVISLRCILTLLN